MDWSLGFCPIDDDDLTKNQKRMGNVQNLLVELTARIGHGVASIPLPILVKEFEFIGHVKDTYIAYSLASSSN
jgi:Ca2+-dependent lipid-binding protein